MKNHIAFKFIAVVLCTASLLAAVGSGLGIFVMTEAGLYEKTVDEIYQEQLQSSGIFFAENLAARYASLNLGSCPEQLVNEDYSYGYYDSFSYGYYGYTLKDAEGNTLDSLQISGMENWKDAVTYEFPAGGTYMHVLSVTPESEMYPDVESEQTWLDGETYIYNAIPPDGAGVSHITMTDLDGSSEGMGSDENIGYLYYDEEGYLIFEAFHPEMFDIAEGESKPLTRIRFQGLDGEALYEASASDSVGALFNQNGLITFQTFLLTPEYDSAEVPEATQADVSTPSTTSPTEETTVSETTPETASDAAGIYGELTQARNVYRLADPNSEVAARLDAGTTVEIINLKTEKGIDWGLTDLGWIILDNVIVTANIPETDLNAGIAVVSETLPAETATDPTMAEETVPEAAATAENTETVPEGTSAVNVEIISEASEASETSDMTTEPVEATEILFTDDGVYTYSYYDYEAQETMYVEYTYAQMPEYTVELTLRPGAMHYDSFYQILDMVWDYRNDLFAVLGVSALLFAIVAVYLCCAAGKKPGSDEIRAAGLNCIPLDAYLIGGFIGVVCLCEAIVEGGDHLLRQNILVGSVFAVAMAYLACLIVVGFCFAFAAQVKTPGGYWYHNTLCGHCFRLLVRMLGWFFGFCAESLFPFLRKSFGWLCHAAMALLLFGKKALIALYELVKKLWLWFWALVKKWMGKLRKTLNRFFSLLPLTWQWLLAGFLVILVLIISIDGFKDGSDFALPFGILFTIAIVLYAAHCFGTLSESAKRMGKGDLDTKVDDKLLVGCFKDFAGDLNALADVAVVAAQKQLKSERMKTELITNVSHDIKTPLTSIINYVDLLQKPHSDAEQAQYLEVLDRQSQRLKKLIGDLIEMSKASTGNLTVDITRVDAVESVNQALGEFADKLEKVQLTPVFRRPEEDCAMMADGRLVWRVLSNLLSNAVKYALPGTRLYIDLMKLEGKVIISLKNISRDELNVDADELMERFVRGDDSRNTEGSGLGLNIAKSLMELQKGQLQLLVDGDLFKVTLIFPGA